MIFKTFDSNIDKISSKWGIFGRSFSDISTAIIGKITTIRKAFQATDDFIGSIKNSDSIWKKLYPNKESIKDRLMDVNSLYPEKTDSQFSSLLTSLVEIEEKVKSGDGSWQEYFNDLKKGEKWQIDFVQNTDLQKASLSDIKKAYEQARASILAQNEALKSQTLSAKAGKVAIQALATAGNMLAMWFISRGIELAVTGIDNLVHSAEHCKERVDELMNSYRSAMDAANADAKAVEDLIPRYEELSKGVNNLGENVALSTDKYAEYNHIANQIADMFPTLVEGYTSEGNAILSLKGNVEQLRDAYQDARQEAYNMLIASEKNSDGNDIITNYHNQVNGQKHLWWDDAGANDIIKIMTKLMDAATPDEFRDTYSQLHNEYANIWERDPKIQDALKSSGYWDLLQFNKFAQLTPDDLSSVKHSAHAVIQTYQAEIDSALRDVKFLANAYLVTNEDYAALDKECKNVVSVILNSINENMADGFEDEISVGAYVNYVLGTLKNNTRLQHALHDLLTLDTSKSSINDTTLQINSYIMSIADALNIGMKNLTPLESKAAETLGLEEIEILIAKIADTFKTDPVELKILFGLEGLEDIKKRVDTSIKQLTDDHGITDHDAYAYLTEHIDFQNLTQKQAEFWLDAANGAENAKQAVERYNAALAEANADTLSKKLTASASSLDTFQSSVKSAYDAYAALLSGSYTASELLDSIQAITKAAADMGETINWEALSGTTNA